MTENTKYDTSFNYWFALSQAADAADWPRVSAIILQNHHFTIQTHRFTDDAFCKAARAGQKEIVKKFFDQSYDISDTEAIALMQSIAEAHDFRQPLSADHQECFRLLIRAAALEVPKLLPVLLSNAKLVRALSQSGFDMQDGGRSYKMAFAAGDTHLMRALFEEGANVLATEILALVPEKRAAPDTTAYWAWQEQAYQHKAARILRERFEKNPPAQFSADLFLQKNEKGLCLLHVLCAFDKVADIFVPEKWQDRPGDAGVVEKEVRALGFDSDIDIDSFISALHRQKLSVRAANLPVRRYRL